MVGRGSPPECQKRISPDRRHNTWWIFGRNGGMNRENLVVEKG